MAVLIFVRKIPKNCQKILFLPQNWALPRYSGKIPRHIRYHRDIIYYSRKYDSVRQSFHSGHRPILIASLFFTKKWFFKPKILRIHNFLVIIFWIWVNYVNWPKIVENRWLHQKLWPYNCSTENLQVSQALNCLCVVINIEIYSQSMLPPKDLQCCRMLGNTK